MMVEERTHGGRFAAGAEPTLWSSPLVWLALVQLVAAYEWVISGLDKVLSGTFPQSLHGILAGALHDNPHVWTAPMLRGLVLPCCTQVGTMVECGELLVGAALAATSLLWLGGSRIAPRLRQMAAWITVAACLAGAFMVLNFYVAMGGDLPIVSAVHASDEGVSVDMLVFALMVVLAAANVALRPRYPAFATKRLSN